MTRDEIELLSGRKLDAAVARVVFGWYDMYRDTGYPPGWTGSHRLPVPFYTEEMDAAWRIVDRMEKYGHDFTLEKAGTAWYATWPLGASGACDSAPVAICRGALDVMRAMEAQS